MRALIFFLVLSLFFVFISNVHARNPFQAPSKSETSTSEKPANMNPVYIKLAKLQQKISTKLSGLMREVKSSGDYKKLLPLILIAFIYGVLHAAGPGHGKAIAASFLVSRGRRVSDGLFFGGFIALLHGFSGILIVLFLKFILRKSVMSPLADITHITKVTSYSIIAAIGLILTLKNLYSWYLNMGVKRDVYSGKYDDHPAGSLSMALVVGMIPCPGTVIIMLFALSAGMIGTGVVLSVAHAFGMAVTISAVGIIVVGVKKQTLNTLDYKRRDVAEFIERFIETSASIAITAIGSLFLLNAIQ